MQTIVSTESVYTFTVTGNRQLIALFEPDIPTYTITLTIDPAQADWGTVSGGGTFEEGTSVTVTATPAEGYQFVAWQEGGQNVSTSASYTFTAAANRNLTAVFAVASRLPTGYTELEYITVNNKCGFNTKIQPTPSKIRVVMDVQMESYKNSYENIFGATTSNSRNFSLRRDSASGITCNFGTAKTITFTIPNSRITIEYNPSDKTIRFGSSSFSVGVGTQILSTYLHLFASYSGGNNTIAKLYSAQIYNVDTLQRDFVPCKNASGVIGLYDLVQGLFYKNVWTGTIEAGPAV